MAISYLVNDHESKVYVIIYELIARIRRRTYLSILEYTRRLFFGFFIFLKDE